MLFKNRWQLYFKNLKLFHIWQQQMLQGTLHYLIEQKLTLLSEVHLIFQIMRSKEQYHRT
jgi:hypothetical protein